MVSCCSSNCPKCMTCQKYFNSGCAEDYYSFGSGNMDINNCSITYYCGELGNYSMYEEKQSW